MKGVRCFSIKRTLAPHFIEKYGPLSYQLELLLKLLGVHNVIHGSQLKRCLKPLTDVVIEDMIPLKPDLTYINVQTEIRTVTNTKCAHHQASTMV
jgi:hypothetical protein